jgi:nanoRNase/pAp phosphatase (c-di-AMP/oligoRNAs hydrolase)
MTNNPPAEPAPRATPPVPPDGNAPPAPAAALAALLEAHRGERHVIVLQNYPDPDAISSAYAHQLISRRYGVEADIIYSGKVSHQQNIALLNLLGLELRPFDPQQTDLTQYQGAVFVDSQGTTSPTIVEALEQAHVPALIVVDHHALQDRLKPVFADLRPTGAAATIYTSYLRAGLIELERGQRETTVVATALLHGILTDTNNFIRAGADDFEAAAFLSQFRDADVLAQIMSQARSRQTMEIIQRALGNRLLVENVSVAGIGYVRAEDRDAIPQAADFLVTEENVHTAIVYGIVTSEGEEILIGSMRTSKLTLDPDAFIKDTLGKNAAGRYFGGGKMSAGGFEIPLGFLSGGSDDALRDAKWQAYDHQVKSKIFVKLGAEPPKPKGNGGG